MHNNHAGAAQGHHFFCSSCAATSRLQEVEGHGIKRIESCWTGHKQWRLRDCSTQLRVGNCVRYSLQQSP